MYSRHARMLYRCIQTAEIIKKLDRGCILQDADMLRVYIEVDKGPSSYVISWRVRERLRPVDVIRSVMNSS